MRKLMTLILLMCSCKASEISSNLDKLSKLEPIEITKRYSRGRESLGRDYLAKLRYFRNQVTNDSICIEVTKPSPPELPEKTRDVSFTPPKGIDNIEQKGLTTRLSATNNLIKELQNYMDSFILFQSKVIEEENAYLISQHKYNKQVLRYYKLIVDELKYESCKFNNDLKYQQLKQLEHELEMARIRLLVAFRPNSLQRLLNSPRNKKYEAIGGYNLDSIFD